MKGLIIKDFFALTRQARIFLAVAAFYLIYSITTKNITMFAAMFTMFMGFLPINTMAFDEQSKWNKYALSMPLTRTDIVLSKYILSGIVALLAILVNFAVMTILIRLTNSATGLKEASLYILAGGGVLLFYVALLLPVLFKFGVEKGRMLMVAVFLAPLLITTLLPKLGIPKPSASLLEALPYLAPPVLLVSLLISVAISIRIYQRKEF